MLTDAFLAGLNSSSPWTRGLALVRLSNSGESLVTFLGVFFLLAAQEGETSSANPNSHLSPHIHGCALRRANELGNAKLGSQECAGGDEDRWGRL
jgi:hypothetical protein